MRAFRESLTFPILALQFMKPLKITNLNSAPATVCAVRTSKRVQAVAAVVQHVPRDRPLRAVEPQQGTSWAVQRTGEGLHIQ